jgi:hypothetical protein
MAGEIHERHRGDDRELAHTPPERERMARAFLAGPSEHEGHRRAEHGQRGQQVERPERAAVAMAEHDGALVEVPVRWSQGGEQILQRRGRRHGSRRCRAVDRVAPEQEITQ